MDFQHISREEREEWLRSNVTTSALAMLREMEAVAKDGVIAEAQSDDATLHSIGYKAGLVVAVNQVIDQLTRSPK